MNKKILIAVVLAAILSVVVLIPPETDAATSIEVSDEASFIDAMNQDDANITLMSDLTFDNDTVAKYCNNPNYVEVDLFGNNVVLDLNGHTITSTNIGLGFAGKNVVIKNGNINAMEDAKYTTGYVSYPICIIEDAQVTLENVTTLGGIPAYDDSTLTVRNCSIYATNYYALWSEASIIVENGDVHKNLIGDANYILGISYDGNNSIVVNGGTFTSTTDADIALGGEFIPPVINSGSFQKDPTQFIGQNMEVTKNKGLFYVSEHVEPTSGSIESESNSVSTTVPDNNIKVKMPLGSFSIIGSESLDSIMVYMESKSFDEAPNAIASFEITIVAGTDYVALITVDATIPEGHEPLAFYIDEQGRLIPVEVVDYSESTVTFKTTHTTPFVIMSEEIVEIPTTPAEDEDGVPFIPGQGTSPVTPSTDSDDSSDDTLKLTIAAAAVVVIMIAAIALMTGRNN